MVRAEFATTKNPEIIGEMQEGSCADGGGGEGGTWCWLSARFTGNEVIPGSVWEWIQEMQIVSVRQSTYMISLIGEQPMLPLDWVEKSSSMMLKCYYYSLV